MGKLRLERRGRGDTGGWRRRGHWGPEREGALSPGEGGGHWDLDCAFWVRASSYSTGPVQGRESLLGGQLGRGSARQQTAQCRVLTHTECVVFHLVPPSRVFSCLAHHIQFLPC